MIIDVKYIQHRSSSWRYRRKVPSELRQFVGKNEIIFGLGTSEAEAMRKYPLIHMRAEKILREAEVALKVSQTRPQVSAVMPATDTALGTEIISLKPGIKQGFSFN